MELTQRAEYMDDVRLNIVYCNAPPEALSVFYSERLFSTAAEPDSGTFSSVLTSDISHFRDSGGSQAAVGRAFEAKELTSLANKIPNIGSNHRGHIIS